MATKITPLISSLFSFSSAFVYLFVIFCICDPTAHALNLPPTTIDVSVLSRIFHDDFNNFNYLVEDLGSSWQTWLDYPLAGRDDCYARLLGIGTSVQDGQIYVDPTIRGLRPHQAILDEKNNSYLRIQGDSFSGADEQCRNATFHYYSGMISTINGPFGINSYFEVSAKFSAEGAAHTTIWCSASGRSSPQNETMQIAAYYGGEYEPDNYQYGMKNGFGEEYFRTKFIGKNTATNNFNTFGMLWVEGQLAYYLNRTLVDSILFETFPNAEVGLVVTQALFDQFTNPYSVKSWPVELQIDFASVYAYFDPRLPCGSNLFALSVTSQDQCNQGEWKVNSSASSDAVVSIGAQDRVFVNGSFSQSSSANLVVYANESRVALIVEQNVTLSGKLTITFNTAPVPGTSTIITGANIQGTFTDVVVEQQFAETQCEKIKAKPIYTPSSVFLQISTHKCSDTSTRNKIIIGVACGVGGLIVLTAIVLIILIIVKRKGNFVRLFWARQGEHSTDHL